MILILQIALPIAIMTNTISIMGLIRAHFRMHQRLNEIYIQCVYLSMDIGRKDGTGIQRMAEDTKVGK